MCQIVTPGLSDGFTGALFLGEALNLWGGSGGKTVSVIYSAECVSSRKSSRPTAILPLLVILFIVSYGILTMLVFEQGQTIESQRSLIKEMMKDSTQLASLKDKLARDDKRIQEKAAVQADHKDPESSSAAATTKAFDKDKDKDKDKDGKHPGKSAHVTKEVPSKPAGDLEDVRRSTRVI